MNDLFWKQKYTDYAEGFTFFSKLMKDGLPDISHEDIFHHWIHLLEEVCDCEGCRGEESCVIHIEMDNEDEYTE